MNEDAETILELLLKITSCYRCGRELIPVFTRPHCDNFCCGEDEDDNCTQEFENALSAAKRLVYQPYIDFSKRRRQDGMWVLELQDLPHLHLIIGDRILVNQKEFVIHQIDYTTDQEIVRDIELIGDFV